MSKDPAAEGQDQLEARGGGEPTFKNPLFQHSNVVGSRKKPWRTLKQLLAAEAALDWPEVH
jgi:hypothetical protein